MSFCMQLKGDVDIAIADYKILIKNKIKIYIDVK